MKTMKKIASLLLALAMIFALATTAFAAEGAAKNDSITVTGAKAGETYNLYKLFDLEVDDELNPTSYSYTVNEDWEEFFNGAGAAHVTIDSNGYVTAIDAADLANAAAAWSGAVSVDDVTVAEGANVAVFSGLENGYWLITSSLGGLVMTDTTPFSSAVTVNEKNPEDTITKTVQENSTGEFGTANDAQIGEDVYFQSVATLVPGTRNVKIYDTMTAGLEFNNDVVIAGLTENEDYTVATGTNGATFVITFDEDYITGLTATTDLTITYSATLSSAVIANNAIVDQTNRIQITYGNAQSVEVTTTTTTHKFSVYKHAGNATEHLADAVFSLKKDGEVVELIKIDDHNYRVAEDGENDAVDTFTTMGDANIVIWGVDVDDYTLEETDAPAGYNKLTEEAAVSVSADNDFVADITNNAGTELPTTGGTGTTLFYILGGILVVGAVVLLVTKKRMSAE